MNSLTVLYDGECGLCVRCKKWVLQQQTYFPVKFLDSHSQTARDRYPTLLTDGPPEELLAIGDNGEVYRSDKAWLMVLYAIRKCRPLALKLARPGMVGFARRAYYWVARNRGNVSRRLGLLGEREMRAFLEKEPEPARCDAGVDPKKERLHRMFGSQVCETNEKPSDQATDTVRDSFRFEAGQGIDQTIDVQFGHISADTETDTGASGGDGGRADGGCGEALGEQVIGEGGRG